MCVVLRQASRIAVKVLPGGKKARLTWLPGAKYSAALEARLIRNGQHARWNTGRFHAALNIGRLFHRTAQRTPLRRTRVRKAMLSLQPAARPNSSAETSRAAADD